MTTRRPKPAPGVDHLLPVVVQDAASRQVLMLAWANDEAIEATERSGLAHFWSRSRDQLWRKGETSGNVLRVVSLSTDCDGDALLYEVDPTGPACHTGARSCFDQDDAAPGSPGARDPFDLHALARLVASRRGADPESSYTARLIAGGPRRPAEKVVEEAGELAVAALAGTDEEVRSEAADLLYHALVLLESRGLRLEDVERTLADRHVVASRPGP